MFLSRRAINIKILAGIITFFVLEGLICIFNSNETAQHKSVSKLLKDTPDEIKARVTNWTSSIHDHYSRAQFQPEMKEHTHARFFSSQQTVTCRSLTEVGRKVQPPAFDDESKMICGLEELDKMQDRKCVVYSIGSNNMWRFEKGLLAVTSNCEIHTFDCTGPIERFDRKPVDERLHFHHLCLGHVQIAAIARENCTASYQICGEVVTLDKLPERLGHRTIDILKMDIEGFEFPQIYSWWKAMKKWHSTYTPSQIVVEIHYLTSSTLATIIRNPAMSQAVPEERLHKKSILSAVDLVILQQMLIELGYVLVSREDNPYCRHCSEMEFNIHMTQ